MSMFRNLFRRQDESSAAVIKFGLFALVLLVIVVGATAFTTYEAVHDNYAVEAGRQYAGKNGWDEPNGQNIANTVISASGVKSLRPAVSQYCGCPRNDGIARTGDSPPCDTQPRFTNGNMQSHYVEVSAVFTPTLVKLLPMPWTFTEKSVTRIRY
jgi:hypothetical protein